MTTNLRPTPSNDDRIKARKTRHHAFHNRGPAGAKLLKAAYKASHGAKPETLAEASAWYRGLHEPRWRIGESNARMARDMFADAAKK